MPLKLIGIIIIVVVYAFFAGFNLENSCNINILFKTFENVPIFLSLTISFVIGILVTLPFTFGKKKKSGKQKQKTSLPVEGTAPEKISDETKKNDEKKRLTGKQKKELKMQKKLAKAKSKAYSPEMTDNEKSSIDTTIFDSSSVTTDHENPEL